MLVVRMIFLKLSPGTRYNTNLLFIVDFLPLYKVTVLLGLCPEACLFYFHLQSLYNAISILRDLRSKVLQFGDI